MSQNVLFALDIWCLTHAGNFIYLGKDAYTLQNVNQVLLDVLRNSRPIPDDLTLANFFHKQKKDGKREQKK